MSKEGFTIDPQTGQKEDETFHGPILDNISPEAEKHSLRATKERVKRHYGLNDETLDLLYGHTETDEQRSPHSSAKPRPRRQR